MANLERIAERLEAMQTKNDELRVQLEGRAEEKVALVAAHADTERTLTEQLTRLRSSNSAELTAHNAETEAMTKRRQELKDDYGDLKPAYDELNK